MQLRAAIDRAVKANVSIYPVDARGLTAIVPGGAASQSSGRGGTSMFSGRGVSRPVRQPGRQPGHARLARQRHGRQGVSRHQRFRRRLHQGHRRHLGVLPDWLLEHQPGARRPLPPDQGSRLNKPGLQGRASQRLLRDPRLPAFGQAGSRAAAAGSADDRSVVDRPDGLDVDVVLPARPTIASTCRSRSRCRARRFRSRESSAQDRATIDVIGLMRDHAAAAGRAAARHGEARRCSRRRTSSARRCSTRPASRCRRASTGSRSCVRENQSGAIGSYESDVVVPDHAPRAGEAQLGRARHADPAGRRSATPSARWRATARCSCRA